MRKRGKYFCFRDGSSFLGNDYKTQIQYLGIKFINSWHLYSYLIANNMRDEGLVGKILGTHSIRDISRIRREVDNWIPDETRLEAMTKCIDLKFRSNPVIHQFLIDPKYDNLGFVFADKYDNFWGIGRGECDDGIDNPKNWNGENKLGKIITETRRCIISTQSPFSTPSSSSILP